MASALTQTNDGEVALTGPLTLAEVRAHHDASLAWQDSGPPQCIDLSGVSEVDSSALALLLEWQRWAHQRAEPAPRAIIFNHPPHALQVLATLSRVNDLMGWAAVDFDAVSA